MMETKIKERPILFNGEMVKAILEGRKTQTRRIVSKKHLDKLNYFAPEEVGPYWQGRILWVRENHAYCPRDFKDTKGIIFKADNMYNDYVAPHEWRSSIFMRRVDSRIDLEVLSVRVERVQDITEEDSKAEGVRYPAIWYCPYKKPESEHAYLGTREQFIKQKLLYKNGFATLWDSINAKCSFGWESNPWVWAVEFKRG